MAEPPFEIPSQLRELAEKNVEQARAAYGQCMDFLTQAVAAWGKTSADAMPNFRVVQERAIGFAKENAERSFALAKELATAKDLQQVLALQSEFAQTQLQKYAFQAQELGQLMSAAIRDFQPKR